MAAALKKTPFFTKMAGSAGAAYLSLVDKTSSRKLIPEDFYDYAANFQPAIFAMWHGEQLLAALARRADFKSSVLISPSSDGDIIARVAEKWGASVIRGAGTFKRGKIAEKGGASAFRAMLDVLERGENMLLTADVPKKARVVGKGIITLAQKSGRPIIPLGLASSRFIRFEKSWDKAALNLPFSRLCFALGEPLWVPQGLDAATMEERRESLKLALDETTKLAYQETLS